MSKADKAASSKEPPGGQKTGHLKVAYWRSALKLVSGVKSAKAPPPSAEGCISDESTAARHALPSYHTTHLSSGPVGTSLAAWSLKTLGSDFTLQTERAVDRQTPVYVCSGTLLICSAHSRFTPPYIDACAELSVKY